MQIDRGASGSGLSVYLQTLPNVSQVGRRGGWQNTDKSTYKSKGMGQEDKRRGGDGCLLLLLLPHFLVVSFGDATTPSLFSAPSPPPIPTHACRKSHVRRPSILLGGRMHHDLPFPRLATTKCCENSDYFAAIPFGAADLARVRKPPRRFNTSLRRSCSYLGENGGSDCGEGSTGGGTHSGHNAVSGPQDEQV